MTSDEVHLALSKSRPHKIWLGMLAVFVLLLAGPLLLLTAADAGLMNGALVALFEAKTHRVLSFQALHLHLLSADPTIEAEQLVIGSPPDITPFNLARVGRGTLHLQLFPLLLGQLKLTEVDLADVDLHLVRLGHGRNNYSFGAGAGLSATLAPVRRLSVTGGHVAYDDPQRSLTLKAAAAYDARLARPLRLTGGGVIRGEPYRVDAQGSPLNGRDPKAPYPFQATLRDGATWMQADGVSQKPFDFRGFDLAVDASGPNLADLGYLFNVTAPNSPPFALKTRIKRVAHVVSLHGIDARIGASDLRGDLISDHSQPRRKFTATLTAGVLTAADIAVVASPRPDHAMARSTAGTVERASGKGAFATKPFDLDGLRKVDAAIDLRTGRLTGYAAPLTDVVVRLRLENGQLSLQPFSASLSPGAMSGRLTFDARAAAPTLQVSTVVRGARIGVLRSAAAKTLDGMLDASAEVRGAGSSPQGMAAHLQGRAAFRVDQGMIKRADAEALGGDPLQAAWLQFLDKGAAVPLRCASGLFTVANGVATPQSLKIDTGAGSTVGHGSIDLNADRIDLLLQPIVREGAKPSLTAPIHIVGDLAHPKATVEIKQAARKSGLGVIAAVIGTPFRAASDPKKTAPPLEPCPLAF